jgi:hypothetical protein
VLANGTVRQLRNVGVTQDRAPVDAVVFVKAAGMEAPWCLVIGGTALTGAQAVRLYARRFTIEEPFAT